MCKIFSCKYGQNIIHHAKQPATDAVKTALNRDIQKQLVIWLEVELLIKLKRSQKLDHKIV